ncbi:MAG: hypothetical protein LQ346_008207 [Caloplaca aetnensis]|nr:MAG: hypothetical protein LQ346_008207 [Caloplaca aetnensis]
MAPAAISTTASDDDSEFVSRVEFDRFYDLHSVGIRREFQRGFEKMDQLEKNTDRRFTGLEKKVDHLENKVDRLDNGLMSLTLEVQQLKIDMQQLKIDMRHLSARVRNATLTRLHQTIEVIHILDQSQNLAGIPIVPPHFPKNVKAFLRLRKDSKGSPPEQLKRSLIHLASSLTSLCRSYNCCAWESWHRFQSEDSGSSSDEASSDSDRPPTLKDAVESYPEMALRDLAGVLGLDVDRLDEALTQYREFSRIHGRGSQKQRKRSPVSLVAAQDVKRQRPSSSQQRGPSPPYPPPADPELIKLLLRDKSTSPGTSEPSFHTQLGWAANSEELENYRTALREGKNWKPEGAQDRQIRALTMRPSPEPKET